MNCFFHHHVGRCHSFDWVMCTVMLFAGLMVSMTDASGQRTYRVSYDAAEDSWDFSRKMRNDSSYRELKRKPILLTDDVLEIVVAHVNPFRFEVDIDWEVSSNWASDLEEDWGSSSNGVFGAISNLKSAFEVGTYGGFNGFEIATAPSLGFGASTRGGGSSNALPIPADFTDREEARYVSRASEFAEAVNMATILSEDYQDNYFEALDLVNEHIDQLDQLMARDFLSESQLQTALSESQNCLIETEEMVHIRELKTAIASIERAHAELLFLNAEVDEENADIGAAWDWALQVKSRIQPTHKNENSILLSLENLEQLSSILEQIDLEEEMIVDDLAVMDESGLNVKITLRESDGAVSAEEPDAVLEASVARQRWFREDAFWSGLEVVESPCEGCSPLLWAEGEHTGAPHEDPNEAYRENGACGQWVFYSPLGSVAREVSLPPCDLHLYSEETSLVDWDFEEEASAAKTVELALRSQRKIESSSGLQLLAVSPFQPLVAYRIERDDLNSSFVIRGTEQSGYIPAIGTAMVFESNKGRWLRTGLNLGLAYAIQDGADLHLNLGPAFRLRNLPELSFTGGLSFSRLERLKAEFSLDTPYDDGNFNTYNYGEFLLENRFEFGFFFGLIFKN